MLVDGLKKGVNMGKREDRLKLLRYKEYLKDLKKAEVFSLNSKERKIKGIKELKEKINELEKELKK